MPRGDLAQITLQLLANRTIINVQLIKVNEQNARYFHHGMFAGIIFSSLVCY